MLNARGKPVADADLCLNFCNKTCIETLVTHYDKCLSQQAG